MGYMEDWVTALARILVIRWLFSPPMPVGPSQGNVENMAMKGSGSQQKKKKLISATNRGWTQDPFYTLPCLL